jgi:type IV pilus assembly protein PilV
MRAPNMRLPQSGVFLIEALIAILIFSLGILTLVAMQTSAIRAQSDAQYRIEAANLADEMLSEIWLSAAFANGAIAAGTLNQYSHYPSGPNCAFTGGPSGNATVTQWVQKMAANVTGLPGAGTPGMQQIVVSTIATPAGSYNQVQITVCWITPMDGVPHNHTVVAFVN